MIGHDLVILQPDFVELSFNGGATVVQLTNFEVRGEVEYVPAHFPKMSHSESGKSFSSWKAQPEYFKFKIRFNLPETRQKWEEIRGLIATTYTLSATVKNFYGPFTDFTFATPTTDQGNDSFDANFPQAVIELPEDFAFDVQRRGLGVTKDIEAEVKIYKTVSLPGPNLPCSQLSINDFVTDDVDLTYNASDVTLNHYNLNKKVGGIIDTIDTYPSASLYEFTPPSTKVLVIAMNWTGTRYEPASATNLSYGQLYLFETDSDVEVTLNDASGTECTFAFTDVFAPKPLVNQAPVASNLQVTGNPLVGELLTGSHDYSDLEGDAQGASLREWYSFDTYHAGTDTGTGETLLATASTYTLQATDAGKIIVYRVTPKALTGTITGTRVSLDVFSNKKIAPNTIALTFGTNKSVSFQFTGIWDSGEPVFIDWGDNNFTHFEGAGATQVQTHTFQFIPTPHPVNIYCDPLEMTFFQAKNQEVANILDISGLENYSTNLQVDQNDITDIFFPDAGAAAITSLWIQQNNLLGLLDLDKSSLQGNGDFRIQNNPTREITLPQSPTVALSYFDFSNCQNLLAMDFSSHNVGGTLQGFNCDKIASITWKSTNTATLTKLWIYECPTLTGSWDWSSWGTSSLSGDIQLMSNNLTGITFPSGSGTIDTLYIYDNNLSTLNVGNLTFNSTDADLRVHGNSSMTTLTLGTSGTFERLTCNGCNLTSGITNLSTVGFKNTGLIFSAQDNSMSQAAVDSTLNDLNNALSSGGSGTITLDGTNAAPSATGLTYKTSLQGKGFTVNTN